MERFQSWHNFAVDDLIEYLMVIIGKCFAYANLCALCLVKLAVLRLFLSFFTVLYILCMCS